MRVPVLKQADFLIATVQDALSDADLVGLRDELAEKVGRFRSAGVVLDVSQLDVIDSFSARTLRGIALAVRLRGADAVIVGVQPDVAFSMVQLGLTLEGVETALDLDEALELLAHKRARGHRGD